MKFTCETCGEVVSFSHKTNHTHSDGEGDTSGIRLSGTHLPNCGQIISCNGKPRKHPQPKYSFIFDFHTQTSLHAVA